MTDRLGGWRLVVLLALTLFVGLPLGELAAELVRRPGAWRAWAEWPRLAGLVRNTLGLAGGTLLLSLPVALTGAVLLYRSDLPFAAGLRALSVWSLFVPLPVLASAWQAALGAGGWLPLAAWRTVAADDPDWSPAGTLWKPWARGMLPAVWVHAAAALPWVLWLIGQGLSLAERSLEEDARTAAGPWEVLRRVTLRRAAPAVAAAAVLVVVQTATEMGVANLFLLRTFAEEVNVQFVAPEPDPTATDSRDVLARAVAVSLPPALLLAVVVAVTLRALGRRVSSADVSVPPPLVVLGPWRWPALVGVFLAVAVLVGVPLGGLVWRAGLEGGTWSAVVLGRRLAETARLYPGLLAGSLGGALVTGVVTATLALLACWLFGRGRRGAWLSLGLAAVLWALPGPVVGVALKETIGHLVDLEVWVGLRRGPLRAWLWDGPSPLPVWWAAGLRFLPVALAVLWPAVRRLPDSLLDAARADGAAGRQELLLVVWPLAWRVWLRAVLAVAVLALGELSAGKLVETPGGHTFAREVFAQLHYGVGGELSALCLAQLALAGVPALLLTVRPARPAGGGS